MPMLRVHGTSIAYTDTGTPAGRPDAPTILFGHGLLFSGWMFRAQVEALRDRYRCVTVDWRGQGASPAPRRGYDMETLTRDATALIAHLDAGPVHYVGLSMGGFVGMRIAVRHGHLLRSLTLLDTSADREPLFSAIKDTAMALVYPLVGARVLMPFVLPIMFGPTFRTDARNRPVVDEFVRRLGSCARLGTSRAVLAVAGRKPVYAELDRITVATQVIVGADDVATEPDRARRIAARIPGARLTVVPDSGHSSTVEQPDVITDLIEKFLAEVE